MTKPRKELVAIHDPQTGKTYRIYTDGTVTGFPKGVWVFNRFPVLVNDLMQVKVRK